MAYRIGKWEASYTMSFPAPTQETMGLVRSEYAYYDKPIRMARVCGQYAGVKLNSLTRPEDYGHLSVFILPNGDIMVCAEQRYGD